MKVINTLKYFSVATMLLSVAVSCSDDLNGGGNNNGGNVLKFNVDNVQNLADADKLQASEFAPKRLQLEGSGLSGANVVETTIEGVNPKQHFASATRATVLTELDNNFTIMAKSGASGTNLTDVWFTNYVANKNGTLATRTPWDASKPYSQFIAVYPQTGTSNSQNIVLSSFSATQQPTITFTAETDVTKQVDLMTATSQVVNYTGTNPGDVELNFRHALTAVRVALGSNTSASGKTIDRVEIQNAIGSGVYTIASTDAQGTWNTEGRTRTNFTLNNINVNVPQTQNVVIGNGDNYTFYMVPQTLTNNNVRLYLHFTDGTYSFARLSGEWKSGTTKTYNIGKVNDDYVFLATSPEAIAFDATTTGNFGVTSYRFTGSSLEPVNWSVESYEVSTDNDEDATNASSYVTSLGLSQNATGTYSGSTAMITSTATLVANYVDSLNIYNDRLKNATAKGSSASPFNLAGGTSGSTTNVETANSYIVSSPGHYSLPLVYGNAIKNGNKNESAYTSSLTGARFYPTLKDHNDNIINSPYINTQNSSSPATSASVVWATSSNLVSNVAISGSGENAKLTFDISKENIQSGNAVVAVKDTEGKIMWSWHIWITPDDIASNASTTFNNVNYTFASAPIGKYYVDWKVTKNQKPRVITINLKQEGSNKTATLKFTQNTGVTKLIATNFYQWGRKDPIHYNLKPAEGSFTYVNQGSSSQGATVGTAIQNPDKVYGATKIQGWANEQIYNLWSMNNTSNNVRGEVDNNTVVKTIYDPSPAGYHIPSLAVLNTLNISNAYQGDYSSYNGLYFFNGSLYIPNTAYVINANGTRANASDYGFFWSASNYNGDDIDGAKEFSFQTSTKRLHPFSTLFPKSYAFAIISVKE